MGAERSIRSNERTNTSFVTLLHNNQNFKTEIRSKVQITTSPNFLHMGVRRTLRLVSASAVVVAAEAAWLAYTYRTPPTPLGAKSGLCKPPPSAAVRSSSAAESESAAGRARVTRQPGPLGSAGEFLRRHPPFLAPPSKLFSAWGCGAPPPAGPQHPPLSVLIFGDSLATGVGGAVNDSPPMGRELASSLASAGGMAVQWLCMGKTGADLDSMRRTLLPALREHLACHNGQAPGVVVILWCVHLPEGRPRLRRK
jgi:hypothetical protein